MTETRRRFHEQLDDLEQLVIQMGRVAEVQVGHAVHALVTATLAEAEGVIAGDAELDEMYLDAHKRWLVVSAEQQPVAGDLRLLVALLHMIVTLERMGDQAVNIAKVTRSVIDLPMSESVIEVIREMGDLVRPMIRTALDAFLQRDVDLAKTLPGLDDPVDRLNGEIYERVLACDYGERGFQWGVRMIMVARALERVGDQAVDIGEQVAFLLTGELMEFTAFDGH
jgi:phosphate transport system protein